MILKHMAKLNLLHVGGRSEAAAKLHAVGELENQVGTSGSATPIVSSTSRRSVGDYWSERGEQGRWVRVHVELRTDKFDPWRASRGPGRKTRLQPWRSTQAVYENGESFQEKDEWQLEKGERDRSVSHLRWIGKTMFIVDWKYSKKHGTDRRRQRSTIAKLSNHKKTHWRENLIMPEASDSD